MPEAVVEKEVCRLCGVEKRREALYCYHCGGSLTEPEPISTPAIPMPDDIPIEPIADTTFEQAPETSLAAEPGVTPPVPTKRRRRRKKIKPKVVEVEWQQPDTIGVSYIIWTLVLLLICIAIVAAAMYLR